MSEENDYAAGWRPEPGDEVEGTVIGLDARERNRPKPGETHYPILTIEKSDGEQVAVHAFHSVLEREIKENFKPSEIVGSHIKIRFEGLKEPKGGGDPYNMYKVYGGTRRAAQVASVLNWGDDDPPAQPSYSSEPPIPSSPTTPIDGHGPLPPSNPSSIQQRAEENFGDKAPWE